MKTANTLFSIMIAGAISASTASGAELLSISHDGTSGAGGELGAFDSKVLDGGADWTFTSDGARTVMTASDSATSGANRLILVETDGISQFTNTGTAADKGWVFEIELELLAGNSVSGGPFFANFGVRSENDAGKTTWIGLDEDTNQIGFLMDDGANAGKFYSDSNLKASLDVASMIGDGNYYNFKIHKYDNAGSTTIDVLMNGSLVLSGLYTSLNDDGAGRVDIQGFASGTPVPSSEVNVDFVNFTLYDNLLESNPIPEPSSFALIGLSLGALLVLRRRK